ncbi:MAG: phosphoribosylanthranilate isomerase [Halofilum sp. (in: g-proteobacteria)]
MSPTRIKICGASRPEDARSAAYWGADAIGLVFHPSSARAVDIDTARAIVKALPPFVTSVGLFLDAEPERVRATLEAVPLDELQFHGIETPDYCRAFARPYVKAVGMGAGMGAGADVTAAAANYPDARGILVDSHAAGEAGGTGEAFGWERLPAQRAYGLILAGGLSPENVAEAVTSVRPDAVDVSTGVERARGVKDDDRIREFIEEVRRGDRNRA